MYYYNDNVFIARFKPEGSPSIKVEVFNFSFSYIFFFALEASNVQCTLEKQRMDA